MESAQRTARRRMWHKRSQNASPRQWKSCHQRTTKSLTIIQMHQNSKSPFVLLQPLGRCGVECYDLPWTGCARRITSNNSDLVGWSLLLRAATVWSFAHLPLRLSGRSKMVLRTGCEGHVKCNPHKNVRSVRFVVRGRGCCCNLSVGVALNARFAMNGVCVKSNANIYVARTSNNRVISSMISIVANSK